MSIDTLSVLWLPSRRFRKEQHEADRQRHPSTVLLAAGRFLSRRGLPPQPRALAAQPFAGDLPGNPTDRADVVAGPAALQCRLGRSDGAVGRTETWGTVARCGADRELTPSAGLHLSHEPVDAAVAQSRRSPEHPRRPGLGRL